MENALQSRGARCNHATVWQAKTVSTCYTRSPVTCIPPAAAVGSISLQTIESVTGGDWGFQAGTWKLTTGAAGSIAGAVVVAESPRVMVGKNMVIYKRVGNGWKLAYDIWNDDAAPPGR